jgi:hypothetical protein
MVFPFALIKNYSGGFQSPTIPRAQYLSNVVYCTGSELSRREIPEHYGPALALWHKNDGSPFNLTILHEPDGIDPL